MLNLLEPFLFNNLWLFMLVLARFSPLMMLMPPLRGNSIPMRIRALIALAISFTISPMLTDLATPLPSALPLVIIAMAHEAIIGLVMGVSVLLLVNSLQMAGQIISHLAGMEMAEGNDPADDTPIPVIAQVMGWMASALFLFLGGDLELIRCCLESFTPFPPGQLGFEGGWVDYLSRMMTVSLVIGIRAGAPVAMALLLANLITALLARSVPQLNILAVGFNLNALVMLAMLFASIGSVGWLYQTELTIWLEECQYLWNST